MTGEPTTTGLGGRVRGLLERAGEAYAGHGGATNVLSALRGRFDEPLRVAVAGKVKSGKSTLLNALVGQPLAATDAAECTRFVTWYRHGPTYRAVAERPDGSTTPVDLERGPTATALDLDGVLVDEVERLVVEWPAPLLRTTTLIDTPGLGSLTTEVSARSEAFLAPAEGTSPADAVLYLTRHLHATDVRFLEAFRDDDAGPPSPVNAIGVLARADEVGGGRLDALDAAGRVAHRYRADPQVRRLCQTVLPVAGLLAQGATLLTQRDHEALVRLAGAPDDEAQAILHSAERFATRPAAVELALEERAHLLDLLGLFGVRLARDLLTRGVASTASGLAAELRRRSGLEELQDALATQFTARAELLKARAALAALGRLVLDVPPGDGGRLAAALEEVEAASHELAELRLLLALRTGAVQLPEAEAREVETLVERAGLPAADRLGLDAAASAGDVGALVADAVARWRRRAEHPLADPATVAASQVVVRTYEGLLPPS